MGFPVGFEGGGGGGGDEVSCHEKYLSGYRSRISDNALTVK